jgi:GTPase involved in cell partitioning and DNA repair
MTGRGGKDVFIRVPLGTVVSERVPDELFAASVGCGLVAPPDLCRICC